MTRDIGLDVPCPEKECNDVNCPFHGQLPVRGQVLVGTVVSNKMDRTVVIQRKHEMLIKKYQRYEKEAIQDPLHTTPLH